MNPRTDSTNRAVLTLIGVLLLAAGLLGLLRSTAVFGRSRADTPLLADAQRSFVHRNAGWFWVVVVVVALLVAGLAMRWLLAQIGSDRVGRIDLEPDRSHGATTLHASALTDACSAEIDGYRGVERAAARLLNDARHPELVLTVTLNDRADLGAVRRRIEEQAVPHAREALGLGALPVELKVRLAG